MLKLEQISPKMNIADIFTKQLVLLLFCRHCDYLMGRVPPQYSSHYQEFHLMTNPELLGGRESTGKYEVGWIGDSLTYAAAAAQVWVEKWSAGAAHHKMWRLATRFWRRTRVEVVD